MHYKQGSYSLLNNQEHMLSDILLRDLYGAGSRDRTDIARVETWLLTISMIPA